MAVGGPSTPAGAATGQLLPTDDPMGILPELNAVHTSSRDVDAAAVKIADNERALSAAQGEQAVASARLRTLEEELVALEAERQQIELDGVAMRARRAQAAGRVERHESAAAYAQTIIDDVATAAFVGGADDSEFPASAAFTTSGRRQRYARDVLTDQLAKRKAAEASRQQAAGEEAEATVELDRLAKALAFNESARGSNRSEAEATVAAEEQAVRDQEAIVARGVALRRELAAIRRTATVVGAEFPLVVLDAFVRTQIREEQLHPGCRLDWRLIAGISKIESNHGTFGGSTVDATGQTRSIIGPRLDGAVFANIPDTDGGRLDGDPLYDRAVGPMQFIPSSWVLFALDGNGDGRIDPRNYYDAALAAGEHLCRAGHDTSTEAGLRAAVFGYNQSLEYVDAVFSQYLRYRFVRW